MYKKIDINGKSIYIVEKHHHAALAWKDISDSSHIKPALLTFDYHTDTLPAFNNYSYHELKSKYTDRNPLEHECEEMRAELCHKALYQPEDFSCYISKLKNDEQIDFAIRCNLISHAYVISHAGSKIRSEDYKNYAEQHKDLPWQLWQLPQDNTYTMPGNKIIDMGNKHISDGIIEKPTNNIEIANISMSDESLSRLLSEINKINTCIFDDEYNFCNNFILDIDLDYFITRKSLCQHQCNTFYSLIRSCKAVTIATEPDYVSRCQDESESPKITSEELLKCLISHIKTATQ